jgi:hypothetical protein
MMMSSVQVIPLAALSVAHEDPAQDFGKLYINQTFEVCRTGWATPIVRRIASSAAQFYAAASTMAVKARSTAASACSARAASGPPA